MGKLFAVILKSQKIPYNRSKQSQKETARQIIEDGISYNISPKKSTWRAS